MLIHLLWYNFPIDMMKNRIFSVIIIGVVSFLWMAVALLIIECILHIEAARDTYTNRVPDRRLGWRYERNIRQVKTIGDSRYSFTTNSSGFRDREHSFKKDKDVSRIIILGDSYAVGRHVSDEQIFPYLLEKLLNEQDGGNKYEVINASVETWGTDQQLLYLEQEGMRYEPDYVMLIFNSSDIRESYVKNFYHLQGGVLKKGIDPSLSWMKRIDKYLYQRSFILQILRHGVTTVRHNEESILLSLPGQFDIVGYPSWDHPVFMKQVPVQVQEAFRLSKALLRGIHRICLENKCRLMLVVLPVKAEFDGQLDGEEYQRGKVAEFIKENAAECGVSFLDLYSIAAKDKHPLRLFIPEEYHFTLQGHYFVAEQMSRFFLSFSL